MTLDSSLKTRHTCRGMPAPNHHLVHEEVHYEAQIGHLRHVRFMGLCEDQEPQEVKRKT